MLVTLIKITLNYTADFSVKDKESNITMASQVSIKERETDTTVYCAGETKWKDQ